MWSILDSLLLVLAFFLSETVQGYTRDYKIIPASDYKLCSPIHKKVLKLDTLSLSIIITEGKYVNNHNTLWDKNDVCTFRVQSKYPKSGIIAVIQRMNLRLDKEKNSCIDYIEFRGFGSFVNPFNVDQHCGVIDRYSPENFNDNDLVTFYDPSGEITVEIFVSRIPLDDDENVEYEIVFTPYIDCSERFRKQLRPCDKFSKVCINESFFGDSILNCPFVGCVDEDTCVIESKDDISNLSTGSRVVIGSISIIFIVFALFILSLWVFKKHKLLCWADEFAHPRQNASQATSGNSQRVELTDTTGARLAQRPVSVQSTAAPHIDHDKDLPPSYDSLFPETSPPSIHDLSPSAPPPR